MKTAALLALPWFVSSCLAPQRAPASPEMPSRFETMMLARRIASQADSVFGSGAFVAAAHLYQLSAPGFTEPAGPHYRAARSFARAGDTAAAQEELRRALLAGWWDTPQMTRDSALSDLRSAPAWVELIAYAERNRAAYRRAHGSPENARLVTVDIEHFWGAYDIATQLNAREGRVQAYRTSYFDRATDGLIDYFTIKIRSIERFDSVIQTHPRYYASLRESSARVAEQTPTIRDIFRKMKSLYSDATFPDVYFVMGCLSSAGTVSDRGLLLGVDQSTATPESPLDELNPSVRAFVTGIGGVQNVPSIVAHELVHFQQTGGGRATLLRNVLIEGGADFIGELTSGRSTNPTAFAFGEAHEAEVWRRFVRDMHGTDDRDWLANGGSNRVGPDWVADLGYYVGYKIARAYYERSPDKRAAVRDLLELRDPDAILRISGYQGGPR